MDLPAMITGMSERLSKLSMDEATAFAGDYAPEHMQIATEDPEAMLAGVEHAGEVLLGQWTPFSAGNYLIGIPATLPTSGYARVTSGVTALAFTKTISLARATDAALAEDRPDARHASTTFRSNSRRASCTSA